MVEQSWLPIPRNSHFSLSNIPFGIITTSESDTPHPAIAIGDYALDLAVFAAQGGFTGLPSIEPHVTVFTQPSLNAFAALGRPIHRSVRSYLQSILSDQTPHPEILKENKQSQQLALFPLSQVQVHLPLQIGDYTDFYAGLNHAYNVGVLFRGPDNALQPNYTHLPVGYHGRASSVVVSGTPIRRPWGQILDSPSADPKVPTFAPSRRLDIELELGAFVCKSNALGEPIPLAVAEKEAIFGFVLMNDWSARDVQAWEYVPLGPFNSKNFGTSISAWVVLTDALERFRTEGLPNNTDLQRYLKSTSGKGAYDIDLKVSITSTSPLPLYMDELG